MLRSPAAKVVTMPIMEWAVLDRDAAMAIEIARRMRPPMKVFARDMRRELGWSSLSERAVYSWERGEARVPAVALLAAAKVCARSVDELLARAHALQRMGLLPGQ